MHNPVIKHTEFGEIPNLPKQAKTRSGVKFDPYTERWSYRDNTINVSLNFAELQTATDSLVLASKLTLLWYAENMSPGYLISLYQRLKHFIRVTTTDGNEPLKEITSRELINYRAALAKRNGWYLGTLSTLLQKWHELNYPGVTDDAVALLRQLRIKGCQKGEAVLTMDPEHGPFTDIEIQSIQAALDSALSNGQVDTEEYILAYLYMLLGQRSVQYAGLKVSDFSVSHSKEGATVYTIRIPRAKQREQASRTEFKNRVIISQIGELLAAHAKRVKLDHTAKLPNPSEAPLFPAKQSQANEPEGFKFHRTSESIGRSLSTTISKLNITSERTGQPLNISGTRFRRTIGTRAATEGHGELVIAELLDHTDTQNVGVYVEAVPGIIERIDRALAIQLAPLAQAFSGVIIEDESLATRADDPTSRICDPRLTTAMKPVGNCGEYGFCGSLAPISCYTCSNFQPWLDGPHEAVLSHLISERDRLATDSDMRIASINDRSILAVAEVVRRCEEIRTEGRGPEHG